MISLIFLPLLLTLSNSLFVLTLIINGNPDYEISSISISCFNSEDYNQQMMEVVQFLPPFIRIFFSAFNQEFEINLEKESNFRNASIKLEVIKNNDRLIIDWDPPLYKTTRRNLNNGAEAIGLYNKNDNTFMGTVVLRNTTYYLQPANKHFKEFPDANRAVLVSRSPGALNLQDNQRGAQKNSHLPQALCEMDVVGDHTFFKLMNNSFQKSAYTMFMHVKFVDNVLLDTLFGPEKIGSDVFGPPSIIRIFPKQVIIDLNNFKNNKGVETQLAEFTKIHIGAICMAALFVNRDPLLEGDGHSYSNGICHNTSGSADKTFRLNKLAMSVGDDDGVLLPICQTYFLFAHEVGHLFGASHDPEKFGSNCSPSNEKRYIMYPFSKFSNCNWITLGYSPCSKREMTRAVKTRYAQRCFTEV